MFWSFAGKDEPMLPTMAADAARVFDALKDGRTVRTNNLHNTADYLSEIVRTKMQTQKLVIKYQIEHLNQLDSFFLTSTGSRAEDNRCLLRPLGRPSWCRSGVSRSSRGDLGAPALQRR